MSATATKTKKVSAKKLASLIDMPKELPVTWREEPLAHLSYSSISKFQQCPERWRRSYLLGEREPANGNLVVGSVVHKVVEVGALARRDGTKELDAASADDLTVETFNEKVAEEAERGGIDLDGTGGEKETLESCRMAARTVVDELLPSLPSVIEAEVQKSVKLNDNVDWELTGYLDLLCEDKQGILPMDVKTKLNGRSAGKAYDKSLQAAIYLLMLQIEDPQVKAKRFTYIELLGPNTRNPQMRVQNYETQRNAAQLKVAMYRIAQVAQHISTLYETLGADNPWPFASPDNFLCDPKYCGFYADGSCPVAGKGL